MLLDILLLATFGLGAFLVGYMVGRTVVRRAVQRLLQQGLLVPNIPMMFSGAYGAEAAAGYAEQSRTVSVEDPDDDDPASRLRPRFKSPEDPTPYL